MFQRYRRQHRARFSGLAIKFLSFILLMPIAIWMLWRGYVFIGAFLAVLGISMFFAHHLDYWLARRSFKKSPYRDEHLTIELTDQGFHALSEKQDVKLSWSVFTKVVQFNDGFLLFQGPKWFNWIPVSSLSDSSQAAELESLLRSKIREYRVMS